MPEALYVCRHVQERGRKDDAETFTPGDTLLMAKYTKNPMCNDVIYSGVLRLTYNKVVNSAPCRPDFLCMIETGYVAGFMLQ